jgi:hypothetical protein
MSNFTPAQTKQLLAAINPRRVLKDGKKNNHLPQQDVLAHLTRIFGFGGFDYEMLSLELIFEQPNSKNGSNSNRYDCCYKATMRLTVRNPDGDVVCKFEDGSTGDSQNQTRADAHDLAMKSAISLAKKRCAIALGDQFGLSLYNKGQTSALVGDTLVKPDEAAPDDVPDVQADVPEPKSMGHDEIDRPAHDDGEVAQTRRPRSRSGDSVAVDMDSLMAAINQCSTLAELHDCFEQSKGLEDHQKSVAWARIKHLKADIEALQEASSGAEQPTLDSLSEQVAS